ncbi:hypothetical protein [Paenibacillus amylolyticus]
MGKTFRPVEGDYGKLSSDVFVLESPEEKGFYLAVFNFDAEQAAVKSISLKRAGLNANALYNVQDLWEGSQGETSGELTVSLEPAESKIFRLTVKGN